jgi:hypothetical protein
MAEVDRDERIFEYDLDHCPYAIDQQGKSHQARTRTTSLQVGTVEDESKMFVFDSYLR